MTTPITLFLDASAIQHSPCLLHLWRIIAQGYKSAATTIPIEYGSSWHIFKEEYILSNGNYQQAYDKALLYFITHPGASDKYFDYLNIPHFEGTCLEYRRIFGKDLQRSYNQYPYVINPITGKPALESTFAFEYYTSPTIRIILSGTIDELVELPLDIYGLGDDKTTSKWRWAEYLNTFEASHQLRFYHFAVRWYGAKYPDSLWGKIVARGNLGCYINGVFLKPGAKSEFKRSKIFLFKEEEQEEFKLSLDTLIIRLEETVASGKEPLREGLFNGVCRSGSYPCPFLRSCLGPSPEVRDALLTNDFVQAPYNPLMFRKQGDKLPTLTPTPV